MDQWVGRWYEPYSSFTNTRIQGNLPAFLGQRWPHVSEKKSLCAYTHTFLFWISTSGKRCFHWLHFFCLSQCFFCEEGATVSTQTRNLRFREVKWATQSHIMNEWIFEPGCMWSAVCEWPPAMPLVIHVISQVCACPSSFLSVHLSWSCVLGWWTWPAQLENRAVSHCASCWNFPTAGLFPLNHNCTI